MQGEPGAPDESFGTGGVVLAGLEDDEKGREFIVGAAIGADDKVVVLSVVQKTNAIFGLGHAYVSNVYRYLPSGEPDPTFGTSGKATYGQNDEWEEVGVDIRALPDGRVLVAGERRKAVTTGQVGDVVDYEDPHVFVTRLLADGKPDQLFGNSASVEYPYHVEGYGDFSLARSMLETRVGHLAFDLAGDKVFVANSDFFPGKNYFLTKLAANGSIDSTFNTVRPAVADPSPLPTDERHCVPVQVAPQADGGVLIVGTINTKVTGSAEKVTRACLERFLPSGQLDPAFGEKGRRLLETPADISVCREEPTGLFMGQDGRLFVTSQSIACAGSSGRTSVSRLTSAGTKDEAFGQDGRWSPATLGQGFIPLDALLQQRDGSVVVYAQEGTSPYLAFLSPEGSAIAEAGAPALRPLPFSQNQDSFLMRPILRQTDGRIVVIGAQQEPGQKRTLWVTRLWPL